jgi:heat shock protein HslJ
MRNRKLAPIWSVAVVALLALAACGRADGTGGMGGTGGQVAPTQPAAEGQPSAPPASPVGTADDLVGSKWVLASFGTPDSQTPVPTDAGVTAEFGAGGALSGSTGCNSYSGQYTLDGQNLTVGPVQATEMACVEEDRMARERDFVTALQSARTLTRDGDTLTIGYAGGELRFTSAQAQGQSAGSLDGTRWQLASFDGGAASTGLVAGSQITAEFADGKVGGTAGCNSYGGSYTVSGPNISIGELNQTLIGCDTPLADQEAKYTAALLAATTYQINGDTLAIEHPGGTLRFEKLQPTPDQALEGITWHLTTFVTGEVASSLFADTRITAQFAGGNLSGEAGCNSYSGGYTVTGNGITVSELGATKMACAADVMAQEQAFLKALGAATTFQIAGDTLTIDHPGGQLMFTAAR